MSSAPSPSQVSEALEVGAALQKADRLKPSVADYVSEGVLDHAPEPNAEGKINVKVEGHDKVKRMLQMMERHYLAKGEIGQDRHARRQVGVKRVLMRDPNGRLKSVREQNERDRLKRGFSRTRVSFGWSRSYSEAPYWRDR